MFERCRNALLYLLRELNIDRIYIPRNILSKLKKENDIVQWLAIYILNNKVKICKGESFGKLVKQIESISLYTGKGNERVEYIVTRNGCREVLISSNEIKKFLVKKPLFVIDLSFWHEHTESEKMELVEQIVISLKIIRQYLHDECLVITSVNDEFLSIFNKFVHDTRTGIQFVKDDAGKFILKNLKYYKPIVLDPEGEFTLSTSDVFIYDLYLLGGIVDKERVDKYGTTRLYHTLKLQFLNIPRFKIEFDCSIVGVPDRINKIIEIILLTRYVTKDLRKSILITQSKRDKYLRLIYEIQKNAKKVKCNGKIRYIIDNEFRNYIMSKLNLSNEELNKFLQKLRSIIYYE